MPLDGTERGVYVIAATPFDDARNVDFDSIDRLADSYLAAGVDGLTILGMMGEAAKLTAEEALAVIERFIARAGTLPVVVGVSAPGLAAMADLARRAMEAGAAAVMVAPPSTLRTDEQIIAYYVLVADEFGADVPIVLQDFPLVTTVQISVSALGAIVDRVPSVVMLKHEDWPGLRKISGIRAAEARGQRRLSILTGNGGLFLPEEMARGADGAMTGFAYPEMMVEVCQLSDAGHRERATDLFDAYLPLVRYEQQPGLGLAVRKYVLHRRGIIASPAIRRPGPVLSADDIADIELMIARQGRRLKELG